MVNTNSEVLKESVVLMSFYRLVIDMFVWCSGVGCYLVHMVGMDAVR